MTSAPLPVGRQAGQLPADIASRHTSQHLAAGHKIAGLYEALRELARKRGSDETPHRRAHVALDRHRVRHGNERRRRQHRDEKSTRTFFAAAALREPGRRAKRRTNPGCDCCSTRRPAAAAGEHASMKRPCCA